MNYQTSKQWTVTLLLCVLTFNSVTAQFYKKFYDKILKQGTVYLTTNLSNSIEASNRKYVVANTRGNNFWDGLDLADNTEVFPFDYRIGFGIRKLARFDYERKPFNYYDGNEVQLAYAAPGSAVPSTWEYQFHVEKERWRGELFDNHRFFIKHTGNYHVFKVESREVGKINLKYQSAEIRRRFSVGKKFHVSAGAIVRTHERAYGYNPIELWLNETDEDGYPINSWLSLAYNGGYYDYPYEADFDYHPDENYWDYMWKDPEGTIVAYTDGQFLENVFPSLMNQYNREQWNLLDTFAEVAPVVGLDFYHYEKKFWLHAYGNLILPYHAYIRGDKEKSYLNRNNWVDGQLLDGSRPEQWLDFSAGCNMGWNIKRHFGIFIESEYAKMWDSRLFNTMVGVNYKFN